MFAGPAPQLICPHDRQCGERQTAGEMFLHGVACDARLPVVSSWVKNTRPMAGVACQLLD